MTAVPPTIMVSGAVDPLVSRLAAEAAARVLTGERRAATLAITVLGKERMRALNARYLHRDRVTDVLAFPLEQPDGTLAGDVYICRYAAARQARALGVPVREELVRLVVHGVLHILGYDHPDGAERERSPMWHRQERYVKALV